MTDHVAVHLWTVHFYDRPLNGLCLIGDRVHWFEVTADDRVRAYALTPEELRQEFEQHALFELWVGVHDCEHAWRTGMSRPRPWPQGLHDRFYDRYPPGATDRATYTDRPDVGTVTLITPDEARRRALADVTP